MDAGDGAEFLLNDWQIILGRRLPLAPRLQHHAAEAAVGEGELKGEARVLDALEDFPGGIGITNRIVDRRVGWGGHDPEDDALVFLRRQLLHSNFGDHHEHEERDKRNAGPGRVDRRSRREGAIEMTAVPIAKAIEGAIDPAAESMIDMFWAEEIGGHHRRKDERNHA